MEKVELKEIEVIANVPKDISKFRVKWRKRMGEMVLKGHVIGVLYWNDANGVQQELKVVGETFGEIVMQCDEGFDLEDRCIAVLEPCKHSYVDSFTKLCTVCNEAVQQIKTYLFIDKGLTVPEKEALKSLEQVKKDLLAQKKLILILDIDNTLLHAAKRLEPYKDEDTFELKYPGARFVVKRRPFLKEFLNQMKVHFKIYLYTMASKQYALDVAREFGADITFNDKDILSFDDHKEGKKSLSKVLPGEESVVLILDDRIDVWENQANLVFTEPYFYFAEDRENKKLNIVKKNDIYLKFAAITLSKIHKAFFALHEVGMEADVRTIQSKIRENILSGVNAAFSGFPKHRDSDTPEIANTVLRSGGKVTQEVTATTTHLIVKQKCSTSKVKKATQLKIPIIHWHWLKYTERYGEALNIRTFDLNGEFADIQNDKERLLELMLSHNKTELKEAEIEAKVLPLFFPREEGKEVLKNDEIQEPLDGKLSLHDDEVDGEKAVKKVKTE
eukprot:TRINITY_DN3485_c0_g4_i2.p1 TRINITY_DN3485_c0_g4~~TRINITY_DN3485_c0_g4_i2.p1  ORF type:complete len:502 (-),score=103.95 TRINITY_DN3485_c0_g4_i2:111-1616(-)